MSLAARSRSSTPSCFAQFPVRLGLEIELRRRAPAARFHVVCFALPHRHAVVRKIRNATSEFRAGALPARPPFFRTPAICSRSSLVSLICAEASCPLFLSLAISSEARLRRACRVSAAVMACRRSASMVRKSFKTSAGFMPRWRSFSSTSARLSRTKFRSSILH